MDISNMTDKELAIETEKTLRGGILTDHELNIFEGELYEFGAKQYLDQKAWEILKSDGMAGEITKKLMDRGYVAPEIVGWWANYDNDSTLDPRKIIEVYLAMEEGA